MDDDIATLWRQYDARLEQSLRLNTLLVTRYALVHSETALGRLRTTLAIEILVNAVAVLVIGGFEADFFHEMPAFAAAAVLEAYAIAVLIGSIVQLVLVGRIDYEEPTIALARDFERVKLTRARITLWTLVLAPLMWVPLAVVTVRAFGGIDPIAAFGIPWLAANVAFGFAVLFGALFVAKRYGGARTAPWLRRFLDTLAGRHARAAADAVDALARYEAHDAPST
jgi:hypothetical protein